MSPFLSNLTPHHQHALGDKNHQRQTQYMGSHALITLLFCVTHKNDGGKISLSTFPQPLLLRLKKNHLIKYVNK